MNKYKHAMEILKTLQEDPERVQMLPECNHGAEWCDADVHNTEPAMLSELDNPSFWRIKPTPSKVPWGPEDVRPGYVFRELDANSFYAFYCVSARGVQLARLDDTLTFLMLRNRWEYSTDGINWAACEKDEVVK